VCANRCREAASVGGLFVIRASSVDRAVLIEMLSGVVSDYNYFTSENVDSRTRRGKAPRWHRLQHYRCRSINDSSPPRPRYPSATERPHALSPLCPSGECMCEKCQELDDRIAKLRRLIDPALDPLTLTTLKEALRRAEDDRSVVQCEDEPK